MGLIFGPLYFAKLPHHIVVDREKVIADLDQGRIVLRAPFSYLLVCKRIPGACWEASRKAWTYPATRLHAARIVSWLPGLQSTERFAALLAPRGRALSERKLAPTGAPEPPIALPAGLKTKPWRHQVAAYRFAMQRFTTGSPGVLLACEMGTGKSLMACMILLALRALRVLIACPLRVIPVWMEQLEHHLRVPLLAVALDEEVGSVTDKQRLAEEKLRLAETTGVPFVAVINYDSVWREPFGAWAERQAWDLVVADLQRLQAEVRRCAFPSHQKGITMTQQLVPPDSQAVILAFHTDLDTINAALSTNVGAGALSEFDLPRIKMPAGGGLQWAVPTLEGEAMEPVIEGVIVLARDTRAYYSQPISKSGGSQPPGRRPLSRQSGGLWDASRGQVLRSSWPGRPPPWAFIPATLWAGSNTGLGPRPRAATGCSSRRLRICPNGCAAIRPTTQPGSCANQSPAQNAARRSTPFGM